MLALAAALVEPLARLGPSGVDKSSKRCKRVSNLTLPNGESNGRLLEPSKLVPLDFVLVLRLELMGSVRDVRHGLFLAGRLDENDDPVGFEDEAIQRGRCVGVGGTSSTRTTCQLQLHMIAPKWLWATHHVLWLIKPLDGASDRVPRLYDPPLDSQLDDSHSHHFLFRRLFFASISYLASRTCPPSLPSLLGADASDVV